MDQYKVGTVTNSTSTMHKLADTPLTMDLFGFSDCPNSMANDAVQNCEYLRLKYKETGEKRYWNALIELLPQSFLQKRTWTANYAVLRNIYHARKYHKQQDWRDFCAIIETLPYAQELVCI